MKILKICAIALLTIFACGVALLWMSSHAQDRRDEVFFSCNEQSINKLTAEQARTTKVYSPEETDAIRWIDDDACMARKGYAYSGGLDFQFCNGNRIPQCYSGHFLGNLPAIF
jgi:hypothetical protein